MELQQRNLGVEGLRSPFSLRHLKIIRSPTRVAERMSLSYNGSKIEREKAKNSRVNHFILKNKGHSWPLSPNIFSDIAHNFLWPAINFLQENRIRWKTRYIYLTKDEGWVEPGQTLRDPGWHIDGLQGDEIATKVPPDFQFIWSNRLPTEFAVQPFKVSDKRLSTHNIFKLLSDQVQPESIVQTEEYGMYFMTAYHVHRATVATDRVYREFFRLSFTHTPITSKKMTIRKDWDYDYPIHQTSGNIPAYLI